MISLNKAQIDSLYRYPVKGFTPERLTSVDVKRHQTFPFDRHYAIEYGPQKFDASAPRYFPKTNFLMLMRHEKLAALKAKFNDQTHLLDLFYKGETVASGNLNTETGKSEICRFMGQYMNIDDADEKLRIVQADNHSFSDVSKKCVHIVNLSSVAALEKKMETRLSPLRFRANIYIHNVPAWEEFNWVDEKIEIDGLSFKVFSRTVRCAAVNVDPQSGNRDETNIPLILKQQFGHSDMGIYAITEEDGQIILGQS